MMWVEGWIRDAGFGILLFTISFRIQYPATRIPHNSLFLKPCNWQMNPASW